MVVCGEGILHSDPSGWALNYSGGTLGEEGDGRSLEQCVCEWMDSGRAELGGDSLVGTAAQALSRHRKEPG